MNFMRVVALLAVGLFLLPSESQAACAAQSVSQLGTHIQYTGSCSEDDEVLIQTGDMSRYSECSVISTAGAVEVYVSIDGANYTTAPVSLIDLGATDTAPVLVTAALRYYAFPVVAVKLIRVVENGTTDAAASLTCK